MSCMFSMNPAWGFIHVMYIDSTNYYNNYAIEGTPFWWWNMTRM